MPLTLAISADGIFCFGWGAFVDFANAVTNGERTWKINQPLKAMIVDADDAEVCCAECASGLLVTYAEGSGELSDMDGG